MLRLPPWFEDAVSAVARVNLRSPKALEEIAPRVEYLAKRYMRQEDGLPGDYFSDAESRRAYLAYFFSTNVLKIAPVLDELERTEFFALRTNVRVLDVGTGVGTAAIGLWMWLSQRENAPSVHVVGTDSSKEACAEASRTVTTFRQHLDLPFVFDAQPLALRDLMGGSAGVFDLIIAQNVLIESPDFTAMSTLAQSSLSPDGALVLIEPASRVGSRTLLECRDLLAVSGLTIYAPCVRQEACPALIRDNDWCHAVAKWERPRFVRLIDELVGNLRLSLKFSYVVALKRALNIAATFPGEDATTLFRIVSDRIDEKGRKKLYGCGAQGRFFFEKQKRDTTATNDAFNDARRYDLMHITGYAPKSNLQRIAPEGVIRSVKRFETHT